MRTPPRAQRPTCPTAGSNRVLINDEEMRVDLIDKLYIFVRELGGELEPGCVLGRRGDGWEGLWGGALHGCRRG